MMSERSPAESSFHCLVNPDGSGPAALEERIARHFEEGAAAVSVTTTEGGWRVDVRNIGHDTRQRAQDVLRLLGVSVIETF